MVSATTTPASAWVFIVAVVYIPAAMMFFGGMMSRVRDAAVLASRR